MSQYTDIIDALLGSSTPGQRLSAMDWRVDPQSTMFGAGGSLPSKPGRMGVALYNMLVANPMQSAAHIGAGVLGDVDPWANKDKLIADAMSAQGLGIMGGMGGAPRGVLGSHGASPGRARGAFELDYFGSPVKILQNPSQSQLLGFLSRTKYKAARRLHDPTTGDTYVWDANDPTLHHHVAQQLGLDMSKVVADTIGVD